MTGPHKDVSKQKDKENKMPTQQSLLLADYSHPQVQEAGS